MSSPSPTAPATPDPATAPPPVSAAEPRSPDEGAARIQRHGQEIADTLLELARTAKSPAIRMAAAHEVLLGAWGRPRKPEPLDEDEENQGFVWPPPCAPSVCIVTNYKRQLMQPPEKFWTWSHARYPKVPQIPTDFLADSELAPNVAAPSPAPSDSPTNSSSLRDTSCALVDQAPPPPSAPSSAFTILASAFVFLLSLLSAVASTARTNLAAPIDLAPIHVATARDTSVTSTQSKLETPNSRVPVIAPGRQGEETHPCLPPRLRASAQDPQRVFLADNQPPQALARGHPPNPHDAPN